MFVSAKQITSEAPVLVLCALRILLQVLGLLVVSADSQTKSGLIMYVHVKVDSATFQATVFPVATNHVFQTLVLAQADQLTLDHPA